MNNEDTVNLSEWYTAAQAADRLSKNSKKSIGISYPRKLAQYGKVRTLRISERNILYSKQDIDPYVVEERGEKSGRAKRQAAGPKSKRKQVA